jgi:hypothetical protein
MLRRGSRGDLVPEVHAGSHLDETSAAAATTTTAVIGSTTDTAVVTDGASSRGRTRRAGAAIAPELHCATATRRCGLFGRVGSRIAITIVVGSFSTTATICEQQGSTGDRRRIEANHAA